MKNIYTFIILLLSYTLLWTSCEQIKGLGPDPQSEYIKFYGGAYQQLGNDVIETSDGGYLVIGSTNSHSKGAERDVLIVKTDVAGNEVWSQRYGDADWDEVGIAVDKDENQGIYVICGTAIQDDNSDVFLLQIQENGDLVWMNRYHYQNPANIQSEPDQTYETGRDVQFTSGGNIVFAGQIRNISEGESAFDTYLYQVDKQGFPVNDWQSFRVWGFPGADDVVKLQELENRDIAVLGSTLYSEIGQAAHNLLFYTTNPQGVLLNARSLGGIADEKAANFFTEDDESFTIVGSQKEGDQPFEIYWQKVTRDLEPIESKVIPITHQQIPLTDIDGQAILPKKDESGYWILGSANLATERDFFLAGTDEAGNHIKQEIYIYGTQGDAYPGQLLIPQQSEGVVIVGTIRFHTNQMMSLIKASIN